MAGVDHTEAVSLRIGEYDEVGVHRIRVPRHACGTETDQALDLGGLFSGVVDDEVEMKSRMRFGPGVRQLQRDSCSLF